MSTTYITELTEQFESLLLDLVDLLVWLVVRLHAGLDPGECLDFESRAACGSVGHTDRPTVGVGDLFDNRSWVEDCWSGLSSS